MEAGRTLNLAGIAEDSIVDGPGIRTTIFAQGCPHHCRGCHNAGTWEFGIGTELPIEEIVERIHRNPLARGVTFSGGEPFSQAEAFAALAEVLRKEHYEVAAYSGYTFEELLSGTQEMRRLLEAIDVLIDGRFELEKKSMELNFRGSSNQRILNVPRSLAAGKAVAEESIRWCPE